jgi:hypothetical protein
MVVAIFFKRLFLCDGDGAGGDGLKTITALVSWSLPLRGLGGATFGW